MRDCQIRGYVQLYTGCGKGKTTAALGLALRAAGHGLRVYVGQFLKGRECGEHRELLNHPLITVEQFGADGFVMVDDLGAPDHRDRAAYGLERCSLAALSGDYDVVVLDEIDVASAFGLLSTDDVLAMVDARPPHVELVLTGRSAPHDLVQRADLVTEMREVKHYYRNGVLSRPGIEY
jgi:cob(I)alamin adenosyltransferase